ncbi:MAG: hypothetical protein ACRCYV_07205, partial [Aeromonas sp.]
PALIAQFEQRLAAATRDPASTAAAQPNALARTLYRRYKMRHGSRPSLHTVCQLAAAQGKDLAPHQIGGWFSLVAEEGDLTAGESEVLAHYGEFLHKGVETARINKSFKLILLLAVLDLDGLCTPPSLSALAEQSHQLMFGRYPALVNADLPVTERALSANSKAWLSYWKKNPIKNSCGAPDDSSGNYWFSVADGRFYPRFALDPAHSDSLAEFMCELLEARLNHYVAALA